MEHVVRYDFWLLGCLFSSALSNTWKDFSVLCWSICNPLGWEQLRQMQAAFRNLTRFMGQLWRMWPVDSHHLLVLSSVRVVKLQQDICPCTSVGVFFSLSLSCSGFRFSFVEAGSDCLVSSQVLEKESSFSNGYSLVSCLKFLFLVDNYYEKTFTTISLFSQAWWSRYWPNNPYEALKESKCTIIIKLDLA